MKSTESGRAQSVFRQSLIFFGLFLVAILFDLHDGTPFLTDNDDVVRLIQIRELLGGHHWFDMSLSAISMPETYISHYSRLVDLPYYLISIALSPFMETSTGLDVATHIWPLVLLAIFAWLVAYVFQRLYGRQLSLMEDLVAALIAIMGVLEFTPGRVDHHNFLMVLMAAMLAGLVSPRPIGGLIAGIAMAVSMAAGLEVLPNIVIALSALSIHAIARPDISARRLSWVGLGMALASAPSALASYGPYFAFRNYCDTFANPWIVSFIGGGLVLAATPWIWRALPKGESQSTAIAFRFAGLAMPALLVAGAVAILLPQCLNGPYGSIDALTKTLWLDRIGQEKSIFVQSFNVFIPLAWMATSIVMLLISAFPLVRRNIREGRGEFLVVFALSAGSAVLFFAYVRSFNYASMFAIFLVPDAMNLFRPSRMNDKAVSAGERKWRLAAYIAPIVVIIAIELADARYQPETTATDALVTDECGNADFSALDTVPPGRIMAPLGVATEIAEFHPQHKVEALSLHRAAPGIHRMFVAFTSPDAAERKAALAPFDYLVVCARKYIATGYDKAFLYSKLTDKEPVPGLVSVAGSVKSDLRVFRIDHSALQ